MPGDEENRTVISRVLVDGVEKTLRSVGNGPIDGFVAALRAESGVAFELVDYREHAIGSGANASAVAYVEIKVAGDRTLFGVGIDKNIVAASLKAVVSAVNRAQRLG